MDGHLCLNVLEVPTLRPSAVPNWHLDLPGVRKLSTPIRSPFVVWTRLSIVPSPTRVWDWCLFRWTATRYVSSYSRIQALHLMSIYRRNWVSLLASPTSTTNRISSTTVALSRSGSLAGFSPPNYSPFYKRFTSRLPCSRRFSTCLEGWYKWQYTSAPRACKMLWLVSTKRRRNDCS